MPKSTTAASDLLKLIFNATAIGGIADNAATSPLTNLYLSLHTADPGRGGSQSINEVTYTGYGRVAVPRTTSGWTITGAVAALAAAASFPAGTAGSGAAFFFAIGTAASGAGKVLYSGVLGLVLGPFTGAVSGNALTIPGGGLAVDDRIVFYAVGASSIPTGITEGVVYWVKTASGDVVTVATSQGGAAVAITASGDGIALKATGIPVGTGITPVLAAGTSISED